MKHKHHPARREGARRRFHHVLAEALGWYGVAALLAAYALLNFGVLQPESPAYLLLNITGGMGIVVDALSQKNWQPAVLNIIWSVIGVIAVVRIIL
jgi:hypothetical protein